MPVPANEKETVIRFDETLDLAYAWSAQPAFWRRMERLGVAPTSQNAHSRSYRVPKSWVVVRPPRQVALSEERRAALSARLAEIRQRKKQEPAHAA